MTAPRDAINRWKSPTDFERWLDRRFERWVSGELRAPGAALEAFAISTPGLTASYVAENFPAVRAWGLLWQQMADNGTDVSIDCEDWTTRSFGKAMKTLTFEGASLLSARFPQALAMPTLRHGRLSHKIRSSAYRP